MGGAASTPNSNPEQNGVDPSLYAQQAEKIHQLKRELEQATEELQRLKAGKSEAPTGGAAMEPVRPSILKGSRRTSSVINAPIDKSTKNNRREEVSAEAWAKMNNNLDPTNSSTSAPEAPYEPVVYPKSDEVREVIKRCVDENILFKGLREEEKNECVDAFYLVSLEAGQDAIVQGDVGDKFFVILSGTLDVLVSISADQKPAHYGQMTEGQSFGELALMYSKPRAATIRAATDCVLWAINRQDYRNIHLHHKILRKEQFQEYLKKVPDLKHLTSHELSRLADAVDEEEFEEGSVIIREGEIGDVFYIIEWGEVEYSKKDQGVVGKGSAGDYFGHKALLTEEMRAATVTAKTKVGCLTMGRNDFVTLLGSLQELRSRNVDETKEKEEQESKAADDGQFHKYHKDIKFEDLERKFASKGREREIILGQGAFGKVQIVKHKTSGETFAMKCLNKSQIVENSLEAHVVDERRVMTMIDHPFLLKLYNSYWDGKYVYLLLELCLGGELFTYLRKAGRFTEKASKFYSSIVLQAFDHLHSKNIVYRDLKPENLMLDDKGYIKVVDFGLAKVVKDRTWTLCGTPDYLAPEIILSKGHDKAVDYWALGILTYEMTAGYVPFYADDPMDVYQLILDGDLKFPSHFSRSCCDLVRRLLNPFQSKRLGNTKEGIQGIVKHRWFSGFDWDGLYAKTIVPPIRPKVSSPEDTSNFDEYPVEHEDVAPCDWQPPFPFEIKDGKTIGM